MRWTWWTRSGRSGPNQKNDHLGTRKRLRMSSLKSCGESAGISRDRFNNGRSKMWSVLRPAFRVFPPWSGKLSAADGRTLSWRWLTSARFKPPPQLCGKWNGKFSTAFEHNPSTCRPLWLDWGLLACFESFGISQLPADHPFCAGMGCRLRAFSHLMLQSPVKWNSWRKWDRLDSFVIISTLLHVVKFAWLATQICSNGLYFNVAGQAFEVACVTQCLAKMQLVEGARYRWYVMVKICLVWLVRIDPVFQRYGWYGLWDRIFLPWCAGPAHAFACMENVETWVWPPLHSENVGRIGL